MKKLLFFINYLGSGGAQRQIVELALELRNRGYIVKFLIYQREYSDFYLNYLLKNDIIVDGIYEKNYFKRIFKVRKYLRSQECDVVISFLEVASFMSELSVLPNRRWKLIVCERSADPSKLTSFKLRFFLYLHGLADKIVANSYENIKLVKKVNPFLPEKKLSVIYNMYNEIKLFRKLDYQYCCNGKFVVLVPSSHRYLKNLGGLIEAVKLLPVEYRNKLHIKWFGSNSFDDSLKEGKEKIKIYALENNFSFYEPTLDIYDYMRNADAIGLFSHFEGLPNAICEGMFLGKPIIATSVSDIPLLLREKENGFLCYSKDSKSISQALIRFMNTPLDELKLMGERNSFLARSLFSREKVVNAYEKIIGE